MNGDSKDLVGTLRGLGETASGVIGALNPPKNVVQQVRSDDAKATTPMIMPLVYAGLALVAVLVLVFAFRK